MKPHFNLRAVRKIGQLALAGCIALTPADGFGQAAAAPPPKAASPDYTMVGYKRSIRREDFAGLGKPAVLRMQQQLEVIYRNLADWQHDFALREAPLNDGVVGPVTLRWLQRYGFNFKITTDAGFGKGFPAHMERMAAFAAAHPSELDILLGKPFEEWDGANEVAVKVRDYAIRQRADGPALLDLVNRYRAGRTAPAPARAAPIDAPGYYTYVLNQDDLDRLGGKVQVAPILATFKDKPFSSKEALKVALEQALKGHADVHGKMWLAVDASVRRFDGFLLDSASRARLAKEGMAVSTLDELAAFGTVYLKSREVFDTYITGKIASGELVIADDALATLAGATSVFDNYHLDQQALDTIEKQLRGSIQYAGVPGAVVKMLGQIKEVDYSDAAIFHSAAKSKIAFGLGMCKLNAPVNNRYVASLAIPNDVLASLQKDLEVLRQSLADGHSGAVPELGPQFQQIASLRNIAERCDEGKKEQANGIVTGLYETYLMAAVGSAARKNMPDEIATLHIKGGDCGCALDDLVGVVYGFYPYWWKQEKAPQSVNFRVLNRMAYYGLTVDHTGEFWLGSKIFDVADGSATANEFVRTARQYNSRVDWLIQKSDWDKQWQEMNPQSRKRVFNRILANISSLLNARLTDPGAKARSLTNFGVVRAPRRGDGVTLYFPNYPEDKDSTEQFNEFYGALRKEMHQHDLWVNILVSQNTLVTGKNGAGGAFGLYNLIKLRGQRGSSGQYVAPGGHDNDEYLLVLLNEPSADAKKDLRLDVENDTTLHGAARADFLGSILPVLHFDDRNWQQLDDDIVYSRDNFGGVGFWAPDFNNLAQPVKDDSLSCLKSQHIAVCLLNDLRANSVSDSLPSPIEAFACVHRWMLYLILLFLAATGIVLVVLFFTLCKVETFIKNHLLWPLLLIAAPALVIFSLLLGFDPFLATLSRGNLPLFTVLGLVMLGLLVGYGFWRAGRRVPQRERGLPQREGIGFPIVVWTIESDKRGFQWLIKNRGTGYAIIEKVEILLDGNPVADARTALKSVMASDTHVLWKSVPLVGQKLEPGEQLAGLSIADVDAARAFEEKLRAHDLAVKITYSGPNNEHWTSDGSGIMSISGVA